MSGIATIIVQPPPAPPQVIEVNRGPRGEDGREIELQASETHLQWRYAGAEAWTNLVPLSAITGPPGAPGVGEPGAPGADGEDGREVELQAGETHLQWRYVGAETWTNLVSLSAITGPPGGGSGGIVTPLVFHVNAAGSDETGDGSLAKPFATLQHAVDVGESAGSYAVKLGLGNYTAMKQNFGNLRAVHGEGGTVATTCTFVVEAAPSVDEGDTGGPGGTFECELYDLRATIVANGGNGVSAGGTGGTIRVRGNFTFSNIGAEGGVNGTFIYASGGTIDLSGATAMTDSSINTQGTGTLRAWSCDLRLLGTLNTGVESGQTAWTGSVPGTDRGGNSVW